MIGAEPSPSNPIRSVHVIVNPASGQPGDAVLNTLHAVFSEEMGIDWDVSLTRDTGDGFRQAQKAIEQGVDAVAVYGGDGTVREVVSALKCSEIPLAILPGGTGNLFAVQLGIPKALRRAARLIAGPHRIDRVDVGLANGEAFVVAVGTGFIAETMDVTDREMKDRMGFPAYLVGGYKKLREMPHAYYRLVLDDERGEEGEGVACLVSNTNSTGISGLQVPSGGSNQDGLLDVLLFRDVDAPTVLSIVGDILGLQELTAPLVRWPVRKVVIEADPPQLVTLDGDITGETPVEVTILPAALKIIVPA